jgi:DUF1365 family protein
MHSCLYTGTVEHRRFAPVANRFRYGLYLLYLDLDELPAVIDRLWFASARRPAPVRFRRDDYLGDAARPLADCVRDRVETETGHRPQGPIRLLTHLRTFGHCFNPVSFYYCFAPGGGPLEAIVAEITNTPWKERHAYVLPVDPRRGPVQRFEFDKVFHVSPFMLLEQRYRWAFTAPAEGLEVYMETRQGGRRLFDVSLALRAHPLTAGSLLGSLLAFPFITIRVLAQIYWQALRLRLKGTPVHDHPAD